MTDKQFDVVIVGGGIIGLATALHLTQKFPHVRLLLLEKENRVARHQTGHNSGVIHSGIYYKPGSYKARLCVEGAQAMVEFCAQHNLPYEICGKVIVATEEEEFPRMQILWERGMANGLTGIKSLNAEQIREIEPHCSGLRGIYVPSTGITDYAAVSKTFAEVLSSHGGTISLSTKVQGFKNQSCETIVETNQGAFATKHVINCAGLQSDQISRLAGQKPEVQIIPFRGEYYDLIPEKEYLVKSLIYPVPDPRLPFLGVHFTRRVRGGIDAGPNAVLAFKREGYRWGNISPADLAGTLTYSGFWRMAGKYWRYGLGEMHRSLSKQTFVKALQRLIPEIKSEDLVSDGSGVRAQAVRPDGSLVDDFQFLRVANILNVCNVPSPAATASLAIGKEITQMAEKEFELSKLKLTFAT